MSLSDGWKLDRALLYCFWTRMVGTCSEGKQVKLCRLNDVKRGERRSLAAQLQIHTLRRLHVAKAREMFMAI